MSASDETMPKPVLKVSSWLQNTDFNSFHLVLFLLCLLTITIDGYDLFVYGAALPLLMKDFHLSPAAVGMVGACASFGGVFGAILVGLAADRWGRKQVLLIIVAIFSVLMGVSAFIHNILLFSIFRFFTGMTVGGCNPVVAALASDYVPMRRRAVLMAGIFTGMPFGGGWAGLFGFWLIPRYGWRSVFLMGALPVLLVPIFAHYLPESPAHLIKNKRFDELRKFLAKARPKQSVPSDIDYQVDAVSKAPIKDIFLEQRAFTTVVFWIMYPINFYCIYGFTIWLPKLMMNQGMSLKGGLLSLLSFAGASIAGTFIAGHIADYVGQRPVLVATYLLSLVSVALVAFTHNAAYLMILVGLAGAGLNGAQNNFIAYITAYYPPPMRATAVGSCQFWGRIGAFGGPALIGVLLSLHFSYSATVCALAFPNIISVAGILISRDKYNFTRKLAEESKAAAAVAGV